MLSNEMKKELKNIEEYNFNQGKIFTGEELYNAIIDYLPEIEKQEALIKEMIKIMIELQENMFNPDEKVKIKIQIKTKEIIQQAKEILN